MNNVLGQFRFPTKLAFEPVQLCNASCFCCPYSWLKEDDEYRGKAMSREQIGKLLHEFGSVRQKYGYKGVLVVNPFRFSDPMVCKDLDLIFEISNQYEMQVVITTNGAALHKKNLELLNQYRHLINKISVSFIGSTKKDIKELMKLDYDKVISNLDIIAKDWPHLCKLMRVTLRILHKTQEEEDEIAALKARFKKKGLSVKGVHDNWLTNRIDAEKFEPGKKPNRLQPILQTQERYVTGCGWGKNLLERLEVMTDGSVVLCCDDAEKHKVFGNVFTDGIEAVWNQMMRQEHQLIMDPEFSEKKCDLICSSCSRAVWNDDAPTVGTMEHRSVIAQKQYDEANEAYFLRERNALLEKSVHELSVRLREANIKK